MERDLPKNQNLFEITVPDFGMNLDLDLTLTYGLLHSDTGLILNQQKEAKSIFKDLIFFNQESALRRKFR